MAAACMGLFGDFKYSSKPSDGKNGLPPEVVWVSKRYDPNDGRESAPVSRFKIVNRDEDRPKRSDLPPQSLPVEEANLSHYSRPHEDTAFVSPVRSTRRCEQWSTLRQMLPSSGDSHRPLRHPRWGAGAGFPPAQLAEGATKRHGVINSPMTRFADDMHLTNREFKMF